MRLLAITIALLLSITSCLFANFIPIQGHTAFELASRFPVPLAPHNAVLFFWGVVYGALLLWIALHIKQRLPFSFKQTMLFTFACLANTITFLAWIESLFALSVSASAVAIGCMFYMYITSYALGDSTWAGRLPISLFVSFLCCLFLWEGAFLLTYYEWHDFNLSPALMGVLLMTIATVFVIYVRWRFDDAVFPIAFIWLFLCIALQSGFDNMLILSSSLFLACLLLGTIFYQRV